MKFFHLSDLHIGKNVYGFSMIEEQKHVFEQIMMYINTERPAAVVIAGDVYDRAVPSTDSVRLFDIFLTDLAKENVAVMLISGNHDSPERLHFASRLLSDKQLFLYGTFDGTLQKVTLPDEYGAVHFWLLPFIKPPMLRGMFGNREIESYDDALVAALDAANVDYTLRNVLVSHQFYVKSGVESLRSESELDPVGGLDSVNVEIIERFDYVALGHLHRQQSVGSEHIRYCGSPIKYSFSEWRHDKSVTVVEMGEKGNCVFRFLPLTPLHDMREIKGTLEALMSSEVYSLADKEDYLRIILTDEDEIIDPMGKLRSIYPHIMSLTFENARTNVDVGAITANAEKMKTLSVHDLFGEFFLEIQGSVMSGEQSKIISELLEKDVEK